MYCCVCCWLEVVDTGPQMAHDPTPTWWGVGYRTASTVLMPVTPRGPCHEWSELHLEIQCCSDESVTIRPQNLSQAQDPKPPTTN